MSKLSGARRRRADAERSIAVILETAVRVLNERPEASIGEIATAAGVTRPTVYAHYSSREALLAAVIDHVTSQAVSAIDGAELDSGPAIDALRRYLTVGWEILERYPLLMYVSAAGEPTQELGRHRPIHERLERLIRRGQGSGEFDAALTPRWLAAAVVGLGHVAGEQVADGRIGRRAARAALERTALRVLGVRAAT